MEQQIPKHNNKSISSKLVAEHVSMIFDELKKIQKIFKTTLKVQSYHIFDKNVKEHNIKNNVIQQTCVKDIIEQAGQYLYIQPQYVNKTSLRDDKKTNNYVLVILRDKQFMMRREFFSKSYQRLCENKNIEITSESAYDFFYVNVDISRKINKQFNLLILDCKVSREKDVQIINVIFYQEMIQPQLNQAAVLIPPVTSDTYVQQMQNVRSIFDGRHVRVVNSDIKLKIKIYEPISLFNYLCGFQKLKQQDLSGIILMKKDEMIIINTKDFKQDETTQQLVDMKQLNVNVVVF